MIGNFITKPSQGSLFKKFRDLIMVVIPIKKDIKEIKESDIKKKSLWIYGTRKQEAYRDHGSVLEIIHPQSKYKKNVRTNK